MSTLPVQTPIVALYTGISGTATSMRITPYPVDLDGAKLAMADFGTIATCTIDPKISGFEEIVSFTGITDNGDNTATLTGLTRDLQGKSPYTAGTGGKTHGSSAVVVFGDNPQLFSGYPRKDNAETITAQWTFNFFPITPATPLATTSVAGFVQMSVAPADPLHPIAVGTNDTTIFAPLSAAIPAGATMAFDGVVTPSGWLVCDGSAVSRTTYATLFAALSKSAVTTVTIASPAVFSSTAHGLAVNMPVYFTTTGALPTGLTAGTTYYVIAAGLTANAFEVSLAPGGSAVNTSGSQSGVHTFWYAPHGKGDGTTTFNVPDRRGRTLVGAGTGVKTATILSVAANVLTANLSAANNNEFQTGQAVVFTATVAGNLTTATTYYIVRVGNNTFSLATSLANAQANTLITLAGTETGSFALTLSLRTLGDTGGEENHSQSSTELASHTHSSPIGNSTSGTSSPAPGSGAVAATSTGNAGSNTPADNMQPFGVTNYIIKT